MTTYFQDGRLMFALPMQIGDTALNRSDLTPSKTTIKKITIIKSGEVVPGRRGGYVYPKNGFAWLLHLSNGRKVVYCGNAIRTRTPANQ